MSNNFIIEALNAAYKDAPQCTGGHFVLLEDWEYPSTFTKSIKLLKYTLWYKKDRKLYCIYTLEESASIKNEREEETLRYKLSTILCLHIFSIISNEFNIINTIDYGVK